MVWGRLCLQRFKILEVRDLGARTCRGLKHQEIKAVRQLIKDYFGVLLVGLSGEANGVLFVAIWYPYRNPGLPRVY